MFGAMATGGIDIDKATSTSQTIIGVISSAPAMIMGYDQNNASSTYPVALVGRVPVKVSLENGPIAVGDRISASSIPGVGKRASSTEATVGIALESYSGVISDDQSLVSVESMAASEQNVGKIMVFVNLGQPQLMARQGTVDLASVISLNNDLNLNGFSILNAKRISGINNLWSIDQDGNIVGQTVEAVKGFTTYDTETGQPYCIRVTNGQIVSLPGKCGFIPVSTQANISASAPVPSLAPAVATSTSLEGSSPDTVATASSSLPLTEQAISTPANSIPAPATLQNQVLIGTSTPEIINPQASVSSALTTP